VHRTFTSFFPPNRRQCCTSPPTDGGGTPAHALSRTPVPGQLVPTVRKDDKHIRPPRVPEARVGHQSFPTPICFWLVGSFPLLHGSTAVCVSRILFTLSLSELKHFSGGTVKLGRRQIARSQSPLATRSSHPIGTTTINAEGAREKGVPCSSWWRKTCL
jgi:hypothetical protein